MKLWQIFALIVFAGVVIAAALAFIGHLRTPPEERSSLPEHDQLSMAWNILWLGAALSAPAGFFLAYTFDYVVNDLIPAVQRGIENAP